MSNCSECKYWKGVRPGWQGDDTGHGTCSLLKSEDGKVDGKSLAYVLDGEKYYAELYTKAEFFCACWVEK